MKLPQVAVVCRRSGAQALHRAAAYAELTPAAAELAGAGSGLLTLGPVSGHLDDLATALA